ncbi:MAG: NADH:ubiquinone reductase (Na(+)-transporting) subunit F [Bacteroidales bacterium]|jgi:Na+-transporting NADH:ubiquinone oxidoreductase subunit F|nr:NADH:ubiquinone reductase (Na(+)-transporting) subunit F [Bacteroidales bacterium]MBP8982523.1 NADH:ubiquinone reductase (Na(+)-transporting) subunit F [Bacteroidales bacterium]HNZ80961.1 NADH:ubiquinone reductase (Na(+)-transporting) subunit F [Bacteroidales bacterium]HOD27214.1 NADH:ubiquinone reductase (Na(+)-transporting) subunit F [Bacteroidales bacterium]HOH24902.1 NADH:ubiquinone reductase (Na(+)-transporting) subunit F [Bacteroidales bacterium]
MILLAFNALTLVLGVALFLVVTLILVALLIYVKDKLTPSGEVDIDINEGEKILKTEMGDSLLSTLSNNQVFLPSACGGGGTCGMCKCRVLEGGGSILPTETGFFSRREQQEQWRLACQVKVKDNLKIQIPEEILGIKKWECEVVSNHNVASFIKEFVVKLPEGEQLKFKSGSYIQIDVPKIEVDFKDMDVDDRFKSEWDKFKLWGLHMSNPEPTYRAYSMANHPAEGNIIMLNIRIATPPFDKQKGDWMKVNPGVCSSYIFSLKPGDKITISGPFGDFHILDTDREMLYIGGGAGMAPLRSHLMHLFHTLKTTDRKISYWYGARSKNEIFYEEDFRAIEKEFPNFSFHIALSEPRPEDNWTGYTGFIHQVILDNYLINHEAPEDIEYYMCGPGPMANAVKVMLDNLGVPKEMLMFDDFG